MTPTIFEQFDQVYGRARLKQLKGEAKPSLKLYETALDLAKKGGSRSRAIRVLRRMAEILEKKGGLEDSIYAYRLAIEVANYFSEASPISSPSIMPDFVLGSLVGQVKVGRGDTKVGQAYDKYLHELMGAIEKIEKPIRDETQLSLVAMAYAGGGKSIGQEIARALIMTGDKGMVLVKEGRELGTSSGLVRGLQIDLGHRDMTHKMPAATGAVQIENPNVFLCRKGANITDVLDTVGNSSEPSFLLAEDLSKEAHAKFFTEPFRNKPLLAGEATGVGRLFERITKLTDAKPYPSVDASRGGKLVGTAHHVYMDKDHTFLVGPRGARVGPDVAAILAVKGPTPTVTGHYLVTLPSAIRSTQEVMRGGLLPVVDVLKNVILPKARALKASTTSEHEAKNNLERVFCAAVDKLEQTENRVRRLGIGQALMLDEHSNLVLKEGPEATRALRILSPTRTLKDLVADIYTQIQPDSLRLEAKKASEGVRILGMDEGKVREGVASSLR